MLIPTDQKIDIEDLGKSSRDLLFLRDKVINIWEQEARSRIRGADALPHSILIDTLHAFYDNLVEALAPECQREIATSGSTVARSHGDERARLTQFGPVEIVLEYQILEESICIASDSANFSFSSIDWQTIRRSIDVGMLDALSEFTLSQSVLRDRLAAALAHDMRNPLSGMSVRAQLLSSPNMPKKVRDLARKIVDNGERLNAMFDELLDALAYGGGELLPLHLSSFDLMDVAIEACSQISETKQGHCTVTGESIRGIWCSNSIRRAIDNLLSNAIKYGDGGLIGIHIARYGERVSLSVHNTGNEVREDQIARLFEHLRRESAGGPAGWGIGLPFVRKVALSHGGSVTIDSGPERGTTFTIDIPLDARDSKSYSI